MQVSGIIEKVWHNVSKKGTPYAKVVVNGVDYTAFEQTVISQLQEGAVVTIEWAQSGNFKNISAVYPSGITGQVVQPAKPSPAPKPSYRPVGFQGKDSKRILEQVLLKIAAELVVAHKDKITFSDAPDTIVQVASHMYGKVKDGLENILEDVAGEEAETQDTGSDDIPF